MSGSKRWARWDIVGLALLAILSACRPETQKPPAQDTTWQHIPLPITYAFTETPGVMLFANEQDGMVAVGNRDPGNWLFGGPPSTDRLEACKAGHFKCVRGLSGVEPIIVGEMPAGVPQPFPTLSLQVERSPTREGGCERFVSTPLVAGEWRQTVVYCHGIGVAQIRVHRRGELVVGLDLRSAEGLLSTGLISREGAPN